MLYKTIIKYIGLFSLKVDKKGIRMVLESSPFYPSLLSVLKTLHHVKLDAQVGQCEWDYLKKLSLPFLLHMKSGNHQTLVIAKWDYKQNCLRIFNLQNNKWEIKDSEETCKYWNGVVIYTKDLKVNRGSRTVTGIILLITMCVAIFLLFNVEILNFGMSFYIIPLIIGIIVSYIMYMKSGMIDGVILDKLCQRSNISDCNLVQQSKYSNIFGFKMDCLAFSFFLAQLICVAVCYLLGIVDTLYPLYFISTVISLPTIFYSIYGQLKVGKICPLCVIIAFCIAIEAIVFISRDKQDINKSIITLYTCTFLLSLSILQYIFIIRKRVKYLFEDSINLLKLKRKKEVILIESHLTKPISSHIGFGNEKSTSNITTILSPSCNHCRKVVSDFIALRQKGLDFRWNIILGQTTQADAGIIEEWIHRFLTDQEKFFEDLILWSKGVAQMSTPISQNPVKEIDSSRIRQSFNNQIEDLNIIGFPRIILNNRLLSSIYTSSDLEFLIADENVIE